MAIGIFICPYKRLFGRSNPVIRARRYPAVMDYREQIRSIDKGNYKIIEVLGNRKICQGSSVDIDVAKFGSGVQTTSEIKIG